MERNKRVLEGLEPEPVFRYFEDLCEIPHGSGNVEAISDYLTAFARKRGYETVQDGAKNVIVKIPASKGREGLEPLILQGHMDMVAVKEDGCDADLSADPIRLQTDGDTVTAIGTSLGADDGIAVAYFCALMDDRTIEHPELIIVITTDEETGMDGARALDPSLLSAKRLVNLDSEDEGVLLAGCAGGARVDMDLEGPAEERRGVACGLEITGLRGGHSGQEIIKGRGNACHIMGRILLAVIDEGEQTALTSMQGGVADNAIPSAARAALIVPDEAAFERVEKIVQRVTEEIKEELGSRDPELAVKFLRSGEVDAAATSSDLLLRIASLLAATPDGVQSMSDDLPGLPETSLNLGTMSFEVSQNSRDSGSTSSEGMQNSGDSGSTCSEGMQNSGKLSLGFSVRSVRTSAREALIRKLEIIAKGLGASSQVHGRYPGWAYDRDSVICAHFADVWEKMRGEKPLVEAIHAGVECGIFKDKRPDLDCVSLGPQLHDIHSPAETMDVASVRRTWEYLLKALESWDLAAGQRK